MNGGKWYFLLMVWGGVAFCDSQSCRRLVSKTHLQFRDLNRATNEYFSDNPFFLPLKKMLLKLYQKPMTKEIVIANSGDQYEQRLAPSGLRHRGEIVRHTKGKQKIVWSTDSLAKNGSQTIQSLRLSPNKTKILIAVSLNGSTDVHDYYILDTTTDKVQLFRSQIPWEVSLGVVWLDNHTLMSISNLGRRFECQTHDVDDPVEAVAAKAQYHNYEIQDYDVFAGWLLLKTSGGRYLLSPDRSQSFRMEDLDRDEIKLIYVSDIQNDQRFYLLIRDSHEFDKIVQVEVSTKQMRNVVAETKERILRFFISGGHLIVIRATLHGPLMQIFTVNGIPVEFVHIPKNRQLLNAEFVSTSKIRLNFRSDVRLDEVVNYNLLTHEFDKPLNDNVINDRMFTYSTRLLHFLTTDGQSEVSVRLIGREDILGKKSAPMLLSVYGGFDSANNGYHPDYFPMYHNFIKDGGVLALTQLRGDGNLASSWYFKNRIKKQRTVEDIILIAQRLVDFGWTSSAQLALEGGSQGATMAASAAIQRPDLFRLMIGVSGFYDVMAMNKLDPQQPSESEYGRPTNRKDLKFIKEYAPLSLIRSAAYPTFFLFVGENDSRVNAEHTLRLAQKLKKFQAGPNPILVTAVKTAGHELNLNDFGVPISVFIQARIMSTIYEQLGIKRQ